MRYELLGITPKTGQWRWGKERSFRAIENYKEMLKDLGNNGVTQEAIDNWYIKKLEETGEELDLLRLSSTEKPEHYIPISATKLASSLWSDLKPNGNNQLKQLFGGKVFENPKSTDLIKRLINFAEGDRKDFIILDSFSGSGTTGHAVMDLNKEDGGNRKFILVQMTEATEKEPKKNICKDITRERIKRAIEKYGYDSGFQYLRVGQPLDAETLLKGKLPEYKTFAKYVYYLCTGENLKDEKKINDLGSIDTVVTCVLPRPGWLFNCSQVRLLVLAFSVPKNIGESAIMCQGLTEKPRSLDAFAGWGIRQEYSPNLFPELYPEILFLLFPLGAELGIVISLCPSHKRDPGAFSLFLCIKDIGKEGRQFDHLIFGHIESSPSFKGLHGILRTEGMRRKHNSDNLFAYRQFQKLVTIDSHYVQECHIKRLCPQFSAGVFKGPGFDYLAHGK